MKNRLTQNAVTCLLVILLLAVFAVPLCAKAADKKQVVIIRYRIEQNSFAGLVKAFKDAMAERGYVEGRNIEYVDILTRSADQDSLPDVLDAVEKYRNSADMFITCGWVSMPAREKLKESSVPQLFVPVLEIVALKMLPSIKSPPETNLSGVYLMYPPEKILRLSRLIMPELKNYAYVYDSRIPADVAYKEAYDELEPALRYGITVHSLDISDGPEKVVTEFQEKKIEAYGGIVGAFKFREELSKSGLPMLTSFPIDIEGEDIEKWTKDGNTVAGLFNPFSYAGTQAGIMTADIFEGKRTINKIIPQPNMQLSFINLRNATRLGLSVSFDAIEAVDLVAK